jgi:maltose O-acetyltransferase
MGFIKNGYLSVLIKMPKHDTFANNQSKNTMNNLNEKEKMLSGQIYDATDELLMEEREKVKDLCFEYNQLQPSKIEERKSLIKKLFGKTTENFHIEQPFYCDYGYNIEIGENFYTNVNVVILDCAKVTFGDNVFIAPNCGFYTAGHPFDVEQRNKALEYAYPIKIGNNVWIGAGCSILPGVTIGDNTVIGAGSVVTKDIPANVLAVGNPCKVIREI